MFMKNLETIRRDIKEKEIQEFLRDMAMKKIAESKFLAFLADEFEKIELQEKAVKDIVMNPHTYADFRSLGGYMRYAFERRKEAIEMGLVASLWGANIWTQKDLSEGEIRLYEEGNKDLKKDYPSIIESKRIIKEMDSKK